MLYVFFLFIGQQWVKNMARHLLQNYSLQWVIAILKLTRFFAESSSRLGFFAESTRFFAQPSRFFHCRTNLVSFQNRLNWFTEQFNYGPS